MITAEVCKAFCMKNKKWFSLATAVVLAVTTLPVGVFAAWLQGKKCLILHGMILRGREFLEGVKVAYIYQCKL